MKQSFFALAAAAALISTVCVSPASAQSSQKEPPGSKIDPSALVDEPKTVPLSLLLYKYAPGAFTDKDMQKLTQTQIILDQKHYQLKEERRGNHVFVFSSEQVDERVPKFAAPELLPAYRQYWSDAASTIPSQLRFTIGTQLHNVEYADGALKRESNPFLLNLDPALSTRAKLALPSQGASEVYGRVPELRAVLPSPRFAKTVGYPGPDVYFALDRTAVIPPLPIDARSAEDMWRRCETRDEFYRDKGMTPRQARDAVTQCLAQTFLRPDDLRAEFDIEIEAVELMKSNRWIVKARVLGAKLFGPHGNLLKTYAAADFPQGEDVWKAREAERRAKEDEKAREAAH